MSLYCDYGAADLEDLGATQHTHTGHKTLRCCECGAEIAPGHTVHTHLLCEYHEDGPIDDLEDDQREAWIAENSTEYTMCERCGDLSEALTEAGFCHEFFDLWPSYWEWLIDQRLPVRAHPKKRLRMRNGRYLAA